MSKLPQTSSMFLICVLYASLFVASGAAAKGSGALKDDDDAGGENSKSPVEQLRHFLSEPAPTRGSIADQSFAKAELTASQASLALEALEQDHLQRIRESTRASFEKRVVRWKDKTMPFAFRQFGEKPDGGWSLYISMHGGGGAPKRVNDSQWENQKRLYRPKEGIYLAPRAPTDTWNLWHQGHIDHMFADLIQMMVAHHEVNTDRVYLMGYSAGGDGVYQVAPRMAYRFAAAAMMAGHPNDASPVGLRNLPFALQVGGRDAAYNRNGIAQKWEAQLKGLHEKDPGGYEHFVKIYPNKGHWMDLQDAVALPWMAKYSRNTAPKQIVWKQDNVTHSHFYWLSVEENDRKPGTQISAKVNEQVITLESDSIKSVRIHLDDRLVDLDQLIKIISNDESLFEGKLPRTIANLANGIANLGDSHLSYPASIKVDLPN